MTVRIGLLLLLLLLLLLPSREMLSPRRYGTIGCRLREMTTRSVTLRVRSMMTAIVNFDWFLRLTMRHPVHKERVVEQFHQILAYRVEYQ